MNSLSAKLSRWLPWIFAASALLLVLGILIRPLIDPDVFFHLRDGRCWVETHFQIQNDPFSYTLPQTRVDSLEWLFRVCVYGLWTLGGLNLLIITKALLLTLGFFFFALLLYNRWQQWGAVSLGLLLSVLALLSLVFGERPFMFTYLFLPLLLWLLDSERRATAPNPRLTRSLWCIPLVIALWSNLHPGFVALLPFLFSYALDAFLAHRRAPSLQTSTRSKTLILIAFLSVIAGTFNPLGWKIYTLTLQASQSVLYAQTINEWLPPFFSQQPFFFIVFGLSVISFLLVFPACSWVDLLPLIFFSWITFQSRRHIPFFLLAAVPPLLSHGRILWKNHMQAYVFSAKIKKLSLLLGTLALTFTLVYSVLNFKAFHLGKQAGFYPDAALSWIKKHPLQGRWFLPFSWGGYLGWVTHGEQKIFMDGRIHLYGDKLYRDYCGIYYGSPDCIRLLNEYQIDVLLVSPKNYFGFFEQLNRSGEWALVYWDHVCEIYLRRTGLNQAQIKAFEYRLLDPNATPYFNPTRQHDSLLEAQHARADAPASYLPAFFEGDLYLRLGQLAPARTALLEAIRLFPEYAHAYLSLGQIAMREKHWEQAEVYLRKALNNQQEPAFQAQGFYFLAICQSNLGLQALALKTAYRAQAYAPEQPQIQTLINQLQGAQP